MNPLNVATLNVNDQIENVNGEIGHVIAVNDKINCVAIAWESAGIFLYNRHDQFPGVSLYAAAKPSEELKVLPLAPLMSIYPIPDPSNWFVQALISWYPHKKDLARIAEHGIQTGADSRVAWAACQYMHRLLENMRGQVIDWTQN